MVLCDVWNKITINKFKVYCTFAVEDEKIENGGLLYFKRKRENALIDYYLQHKEE